VVVIGTPEKPDYESYENIRAERSAVEPRFKIGWEAPFWMLYTSGTTGEPKGVIRSHRRTALCGWYAVLEFGLTRNDYFLAISPFFHGVTFFPLMVLQMGGSVFVADQFDPDKMLRVIEEKRITSSFMVPTMLNMILDSPIPKKKSFPTLRMLVTGGAPLPTRVKKQIAEDFGSVLYEFYGASESGFLTVLHPEDQLRKQRCCGQPCFGAEIEVRDENGLPLPPGRVGELFSRCAGRFDEYYQKPEETKEALSGEWFTAGDLGFMDDEAYVYVVDRKKDMIISGGENIYPREIEDVLRFHSSVDDCAVFGIPDDIWGEAVMAYIVPKQAAEVSKEEIRAHCSEHLAGFKRPKFITLVDKLPKTASGKTMKGDLRAKYWADKKEKI
jgi:acyl-CoA synthetase (AMP-forming)/AMP-acid ligase II